jgi:hypothetical protein
MEPTRRVAPDDVGERPAPIDPEVPGHDASLPPLR